MSPWITVSLCKVGRNGVERHIDKSPQKVYLKKGNMQLLKKKSVPFLSSCVQETVVENPHKARFKLLMFNFKITIFFFACNLKLVNPALGIKVKSRPTKRTNKSQVTSLEEKKPTYCTKIKGKKERHIWLILGFWAFHVLAGPVHPSTPHFLTIAILNRWQVQLLRHRAQDADPVQNPQSQIRCQLSFLGRTQAFPLGWL